MAQKTWDVRVHTAEGSESLGQVRANDEEHARCAALAKFGIPEDDDHDPNRLGIRVDDEFDVSPA